MKMGRGHSAVENHSILIFLRVEQLKVERTILSARGDTFVAFINISSP
jgi:hypothetical protein